MWFTILNREDISNNLYKKAMVKVFEAGGENLILGYGYISNYEVLRDKFKYEDKNLFQYISGSALKKIYLIGTNETGMKKYRNIAKEINKLNEKISIVVFQDEDKSYHKKVAISYSDKKAKIAVIGSSNFTSTCLFEDTVKSDDNFFQKNLDIIFGDYKTISDLSSSYINPIYKKFIGELKDDDVKHESILSEKYVSMDIEIMLEDVINEVEDRWYKNYKIGYMNKSFIESLSNDEKYKIMDEERFNKFGILDVIPFTTQEENIKILINQYFNECKNTIKDKMSRIEKKDKKYEEYEVDISIMERKGIDFETDINELDLGEIIKSLEDNRAIEPFNVMDRHKLDDGESMLHSLIRVLKK